jgi:superfamily II DNA or RNA helicase
MYQNDYNTHCIPSDEIKSEEIKIELRDYQDELINKIRRSIQNGHKRIIVQSHVGSGKTVIASQIMRSATEKLNRVIFFAPRRQLIYQTVETLSSYGISSGVIMAGVPRFTQPKIQCASFDTVVSRVSNNRMSMPEANIAIADEAHMTYSKARLEVLSHYDIVLGLTATPCLANGLGMGGFYTDIVESLSMSEMVEKGYLVPMRYFIGMSPDLSGCRLDQDGDWREADLAKVNDNAELIGDIYKNWKRIAGDRTTLVFAVNRKHAVHLHNEFISHGVTCDYIDGDTPPDERERIRLDVDSGKTQVVVNIGVMIAGVNWPRISCIVMARQTRNIATWIQCLGRGSRLYPGKTDTIVIYHGDNFDELGPIDDPIEWSLDDKETVKDRKQRKKKEQKEPKDIKCKVCSFIFKSSKTCPNCGHEIVSKGEKIPVHDIELQEIVTKSKVTPEYKAQFYSQLLGYQKIHRKADNYALAIFRSKFGEWPYNKNNAKPVQPTQEVLDYIKSENIRYAKSKKRRAA